MPNIPLTSIALTISLCLRVMFALPDSVGMPAVAWSNWVSIEMKTYGDIAYLVNHSTREAGGWDGYSMGLPGATLPAFQQLNMRRAYYAAVTHTDANIGTVIDALDSTGLRDNTVICFFTDHGWSLGEHGEWAKHTNFELDVHAPWILSMPSEEPGLLTHGPSNPISDVFTEHVDIMPTLLEAAAGVAIGSCNGTFKEMPNLCTMGVSRVPLLQPTKPIDGTLHHAAAIRRMQLPANNAAFSQYERPYAGGPGGAVMDTSWCAMANGEGNSMACTVGYTMVGLYSPDMHRMPAEHRQGRAGTSNIEYRYTEWVGFNTARTPLTRDWSDVSGIELYVHNGSTAELVNLAADPEFKDVVASFSKRLHAGPTSGGGWGDRT